MAAERYTVVFRHLGDYRVATSDAPDLHEAPFHTKEAALLAARKMQADQNADPNFILDLTNADPKELGAYLR